MTINNSRTPDLWRQTIDPSEMAETAFMERNKDGMRIDYRENFFCESVSVTAE